MAPSAWKTALPMAALALVLCGGLAVWQTSQASTVWQAGGATSLAALSTSTSTQVAHALSTVATTVTATAALPERRRLFEVISSHPHEESSGTEESSSPAEHSSAPEESSGVEESSAEESSGVEESSWGDYIVGRGGTRSAARKLLTGDA